jgi:hypothetical protein
VPAANAAAAVMVPQPFVAGIVAASRRVARTL